MKLFSKSQKIILISLSFLLLALFGGYFIREALQATPQSGAITPYLRLRPATPFLTENTKWGVNVGGSLAESPQSVFVAPNGEIHIFGSTTSTDYDCFKTEQNIFMTILSQFGSTKDFIFFGYEGIDTLNAVIIGEGGYVMSVTSGETHRLINIDYSGKIISESVIDSVRHYDYNALNLLDNGYSIILSSTLDDVKSMRIVYFDFSLKLVWDCAIDKVGSLDFVNSLASPDGGNYILANYTLSKTLLSLIIYCPIGGSPQFSAIELDANYYAKSIMPTDFGYVLNIIDINYQLHTVFLSETFAVITSTKQNKSDITNAKLIFAFPNSYTLTYNKSIYELYMLDDDYNLSKKLDLLRYTSITTIYSNGKNIILCGCDNRGISISIITGDKIAVTQLFTATESAPTLAISDQLYLACATTNPRYSFGSSDILVASL